MAVDTIVVGRAGGDARQRPAGHQDQPAAELLDRRHLHLVGADHVVDTARLVGRQVVGAAAAGQPGAGEVARGVDRAADQFERGRPVQPHAALRGVHRLGHPQAQRPQPAPVGDRRVPVDGALQPGVDGGQRVGDHMRRRVGDAVQRGGGAGRLEVAGAAQRPGLESSVGGGQRDLHGAQTSSAGTSTQRRSRQLCNAASTSCTPLAPSGSVQR